MSEKCSSGIFGSRDSYRGGGEDLGYPQGPKIHSVLTLFGIITTKYIYFTIFTFGKDMHMH